MSTGKLKKIEKNESYGQKIYQQLKGLIISGVLSAGSVINEREYSDLLGVSRTPLRDALNILEQEGWVEQSGKARKVSVLRWRNMLELLEIREPMEMLAFDLAFSKITDKDIEHLEEILHRMAAYSVENENDYYTIMQLDTDFHYYFNRIAGNAMLSKLTDEMRDRIARSSVLSLKYSNMSGGDFAANHYPVMEALKVRDKEKAHAALREHYNSWEKRIRDLPANIGFDAQNPDAPIYEEFVKQS